MRHFLVLLQTFSYAAWWARGFKEHHSLHLSSIELSVWTRRKLMDPAQVSHRFPSKMPSSALPRSHSFHILFL